MKEIVKYHNDLNTTAMRRWTGEEMNLFFAIITRIRDKGSQSLIFETDELYRLVQYSGKNKKRWEETIKNAVKKISQLTYWEETEKTFTVMPVFKKFSADFENMNLTVVVSDEYEYIFNKLDKYFTIFCLTDFINIRSTYAKNMYRLLKQWRTMGKKEFKKEDLYIMLDIPKSIQANNNFNKRVLTPIKEELALVFKDLKIKPVKAKTRGNPVIAYEFTWEPEVIRKTIENIDVPKENNVKNTKKTDFEPDELIRISKQLMGFD